MRVFLLSVMCGVLLVATVQAKSTKAPPKQATPSASPAAAAAPEQPWLQMEITPLEKEIVKQHLVDIRAAQSKKLGSDKARPPGLAKKGARSEKLPPGWQKKIARGEVLPQTGNGQAKPRPEAATRSVP